VAELVPENPQQQLDWEARHRSRAAVAAAIGAIGVLAGQIIEQVVISGAPTLPLLAGLEKLAAPGSVLEQQAGQLAVAKFLDDHAFGMISSRAITAIGYFALAYAVTFLAAATRARRPKFPRWAFYLPIIGAVLFGVAWIAWGFGRIADARELLDGPGTIAEVQDIGDTGLSRASEVLLGPAALVLTIGMVLVSLNAMRAGLLTRFMGALGMVAAALQVIQYGAGIPLVLAFWLAGLAVLFLGHRPGGDPPAWRTGREEPWPSAREQAAARAAQSAEAGHEEGESAGEPVPAGAHPATSRRKRKRRT
jgi:hypothetical protein